MFAELEFMGIAGAGAGPTVPGFRLGPGGAVAGGVVAIPGGGPTMATWGGAEGTVSGFVDCTAVIDPGPAVEVAGGIDAVGALAPAGLGWARTKSPSGNKGRLCLGRSRAAWASPAARVPL
jgi:hypothetical protein